MTNHNIAAADSDRAESETAADEQHSVFPINAEDWSNDTSSESMETRILTATSLVLFLLLCWTVSSREQLFQNKADQNPILSQPQHTSDEEGRSERTQQDPLFRNVAKKSGLVIPHWPESFIAPDHLLNTTGQGVGVLDFNLDTIPDLVLVSPQTANADVVFLFQNTGEERFVRVSQTEHCLQFDTESSSVPQGISTGDYNADGFTDFYITTQTKNHFYENNGDGTFSEVTAQTETAGDDWSLSAAMADFNDDALPDLYVVNYLDRNEVADKVCQERGHPKTCSPRLFASAQDRVYLNLGNGTFEDITDLSGIRNIDGKGMGIVTADFDLDSKLEIYVSNDTTPNCFFKRVSALDVRLPVFENMAIRLGVAVDRTGESQASMGIAIGDVDQNGRLDLLVSNYYSDWNTLYLQNSEGLFSDQTVSVGLDQTSLDMLGFSTQFLDVERDGDLDLFITNGHVDSSRATGIEDRMKPELFLQLKNGRFEQRACSSPACYLNQKVFGRGLALLDWNRDGYEDCCITHLDEPPALLSNVSQESLASHHNGIVFFLVGRNCERVPIGTSMTIVTTNGNRLTRQLTSGNGYLSSNEKKLHFGMGNNSHIREIQVQWKSGEKQRLGAIALNRRYLLIEGREPLELPDE